MNWAQGKHGSYSHPSVVAFGSRGQSVPSDAAIADQAYFQTCRLQGLVQVIDRPSR